MPEGFRKFLYEMMRLKEMYWRRYKDIKSTGPDKSFVDAKRLEFSEKTEEFVKTLKAQETNPAPIFAYAIFTQYETLVNDLGAILGKCDPNPNLDVLRQYTQKICTKDSLYQDLDQFAAQHRDPYDVETIFGIKDSMIYSEDLLERKMQKAALRLSLSDMPEWYARSNSPAETIRKKYQEKAAEIQNGTSSCLSELRSIPAEKREKICDYILSQGPESEYIDLRAYQSGTVTERSEQDLQQYIDSFFIPETSGDPLIPKNSSKAVINLITSVNEQISDIKLPVPKGLDKDDITVIVMTAFLDDSLIAQSYEKVLQSGGSSIVNPHKIIETGRMAFTENVLRTDNRANMQQMRRGIPIAREHVEKLLNPYTEGNREIIAGMLLTGLSQNLRYMKSHIRPSVESAFYFKCVSGALKILDSEDFRSIVGIPPELRREAEDVLKLYELNGRLEREIKDRYQRLNDYCLAKLAAGDQTKPESDPGFMKLYSAWYARQEYQIMIEDYQLKQRDVEGKSAKLDSDYIDRKISPFERKLLRDYDGYFAEREKLPPLRSQQKLFRESYKSWDSALLKNFRLFPEDTVFNTLDLLDQSCILSIRKAVNGLDRQKYGGLRDRLLARPPLDGSKLSASASREEIEFRVQQYKDLLDYCDNLLGDRKIEVESEVAGITMDFRDVVDREYKNMNRYCKRVLPDLDEIRKREDLFDIFTGETNELQEKYENLPGNARRNAQNDYFEEAAKSVEKNHLKKDSFANEIAKYNEIFGKELNTLRTLSGGNESLQKTLRQLESAVPFLGDKSESKKLAEISAALEREADRISAVLDEADEDLLMQAQNANVKMDALNADGQRIRKDMKILSSVTKIMSGIDQLQDVIRAVSPRAAKTKKNDELTTRLQSIADASLKSLKYLDLKTDQQEVCAELVTAVLCREQVRELQNGKNPFIKDASFVQDYVDRIMETGAFSSLLDNKAMNNAVRALQSGDLSEKPISAITDVILQKIKDAPQKAQEAPQANIPLNK